MHVALLIYSAQ